MTRILNVFRETQPYALDDPRATLYHRDLIRRKSFLNKLYLEWYGGFLKQLPDLPEGIWLEIGSGGSFIKELEPRILTSDILDLPTVDRVFSATDMPLEDTGVSAVFLMDVLHHIPDPEAFFSEVQRVLKPGGLLYMVEPANTAFSRLIYKNLHHEPFDEKARDWKFPSQGPLSDANGALPSLIFRRDVEHFHRLFPDLSLENLQLHTPFRYLLTGGLSYRSVVPGWSFGAVTLLEKALKPMYGGLAMFQTITVRKL